MTEPITYRRATSNDVLALCELGQILNANHHAAHPTFFAPSTTDVVRDESHWLPNLVAEDRATFIAEQGCTPAGFITVQVTPSTSPLLQPVTIGRIGSVCVIERLRGQGVGRALMSLAEKWAQENGAMDLRLNVWAFNKHAALVYQELGYQIRAFEMGKPLATKAKTSERA